MPTTVTKIMIWQRMGEGPGLKYCSGDELIEGRCAGCSGIQGPGESERDCHAHHTHTHTHTDIQTDRGPQETQGKWETQRKKNKEELASINISFTFCYITLTDTFVWFDVKCPRSDSVLMESQQFSF